jgi:phospholipase C
MLASSMTECVSILRGRRNSTGFKGGNMKISLLVLPTLLALAAPAFAAVTVTSPTNGSTVTSPVHYVASATTTTCSKGVASMGIYVNNKLTYVVDADTMNTELTLSVGSQQTIAAVQPMCMWI